MCCLEWCTSFPTRVLRQLLEKALPFFHVETIRDSHLFYQKGILNTPLQPLQTQQVQVPKPSDLALSSDAEEAAACFPLPFDFTSFPIREIIRTRNQKMSLLRRALLQCHRTTAVLRRANSPSNNGNNVPMQLGSWCQRVYSSDTGAMSGVDSFSENKRREINRLLYRSKQRGLLELDLVLGKWVQENIHSLDDARIAELKEVLELENPDLWKWLTSQEPAPEVLMKNQVFFDLHKMISTKLSSYSSPKTRAPPGQPWVRGWDDKRGLGGPVSGNQ